MAKEERIVPAISEQRMKLQDNRRNTWFFDVPVGVTPDDLQEPKFWAHVSRKLRQCDKVECICEDFSWFAELMVGDAGLGFATMIELRRRDLREVTPSETGVGVLPGHSVSYGGTHALWRVIRDVDKQVLKDKCTTKGEALQWLGNYSRTVNRDQKVA